MAAAPEAPVPKSCPGKAGGGHRVREATLAVMEAEQKSENTSLIVASGIQQIDCDAGRVRLSSKKQVCDSADAHESSNDQGSKATSVIDNAFEESIPLHCLRKMLEYIHVCHFAKYVSTTWILRIRVHAQGYAGRSLSISTCIAFQVKRLYSFIPRLRGSRHLAWMKIT